VLAAGNLVLFDTDTTNTLAPAVTDPDSAANLAASIAVLIEACTIKCLPLSLVIGLRQSS
jgi:hypothetical protein